MSRTFEIPFKPTNQIWRTYKHFPYKAWYAIGELVDNSTQSFMDNTTALRKVLKAEGEPFRVVVSLDTKARRLVVSDNAMGMGLDVLKRAVQLAALPPDTSGRCEFGMGLKTACSWLGNKWSVRTKQLGEEVELSFSIDINTHSASLSESLVVTEKQINDPKAHYTIVTIDDVRGEVLQTRTQGKIKTYLAEMYRNDIRGGVLSLMWDTTSLEPSSIEILRTEFEVEGKGGAKRVEMREWRKDVSFDVELDPVTKRTGRVTGWICIVAPPAGRSKAGFDLFRRGRAIVGRPVGYRPETVFGEARNDLINQRLYGEFHLNDFPVNHLKDDFLWDTWGNEFDDKLAQACSDYVKKAREPGKKGRVPPAVVQATNDEIAEGLSAEAMAAKINLLETVGPTPPPPDEERRAEAEILRNQAIPPRVVEVAGYTYRIYHPQGMLPDQQYVRYEAPDVNAIDIFINDNHPHLAAIGEQEGAAEKYQMHALNCVIDAVSAHLLEKLGTAGGVGYFLQYKDTIMRVLRA